jgi:hypothetical protein
MKPIREMMEIKNLKRFLPRRTLAVCAFFVLMASWAGAQSTASVPLAAEQLRLFQSNRVLLEQLVEHGIDLANADTHVERVRACHASTWQLGKALRDAAERDDPDRVVELGDYLNQVIAEGLLPSIDEARMAIPAGTEAERELTDLTLQAAEETRNFSLAIPALGKVGSSVKVSETRARLEDAGVNLQRRATPR